MFAFYQSDWFTLLLEIIFLLFIAYDFRRYFQTRKREYLMNIVFAVLFFFWALVPFYNKYFTWQDADRESLLAACVKEHNGTYCTCFDDMLFKEYDFDTFQLMQKQKDEDYLEFIEDTDKECRGEGSWF